MTSEKKDSMYKQITILLLSTLMTLTGYTAVQMKQLYDDISVIKTLKVSDHNDIQEMKANLSENNRIDKTEHQKLEDDIINLKAGQSEHTAEITIIQSYFGIK